jgi:CubicO group peptidase (beta-lactamase class C family)
MSTNQLTPEQMANSEFFPIFSDTHGWGYGVAVTTAPDAISKTPGRYGWFGGFGTSWINDPSRNLISIVMTQSADFLFSGALDGYWRAVYGNSAGPAHHLAAGTQCPRTAFTCFSAERYGGQVDA